MEDVVDIVDGVRGALTSLIIVGDIILGREEHMA